MNIRTRLWSILTNAYPAYLRWRYGMDIGRNCRISWKARFDKNINPKGIHIGDNTWILTGAVIFAHDHCRNMKADVVIGKDCVIGINTIIMPGVSIGNQSVIGGVVSLPKIFHHILLRSETLQKLLKKIFLL